MELSVFMDIASVCLFIAFEVEVCWIGKHGSETVGQTAEQ